jgi:5-methyltetrahydrofolate--homocysteine methyltransferase
MESGDQTMNPAVQAVFETIVTGKRAVADERVNAALAAGIDPAEILNEGMIAAMHEVGRRFVAGDYYVPEMLLAARAMTAGLGVLQPHLASDSVKAEGKVVAGTVRGDLHDIGKNLVCMMLRGAGFEVVDLGNNVAPDQFVEAVRAHRPQIVAMSALLTTTMRSMHETIRALETAGLRDQVRVLVGGAPLTDDYAHEIGADAFALDAGRTVSVAQSLVSGSREQ